MSQVRCCFCGEWTEDAIDKDMSTILCRTCAEADNYDSEEYAR